MKITKTNNTGYTVTTKKTKCNGTKFKGYLYTVEITDGKHTANFQNNGESSIRLEDFASGENSYGSKFYMCKGENILHQLVSFGKRTDSKQQKQELMNFINSVLHTEIKFNDGIMTYNV